MKKLIEDSTRRAIIIIFEFITYIILYRINHFGKNPNSGGIPANLIIRIVRVMNIFLFGVKNVFILKVKVYFISINIINE
jgi:hypothetical protein